MRDYLNSLEKDTTAVKSKNKLFELILVAAYLGIQAISLIVFWFFTSDSDAMGYSIMFLWVLLPVTTFVVSLLIGRRNCWGKWKWASAVVFGILYMLAEYATFSAANMVVFNKVNQYASVWDAPHWSNYFYGWIGNRYRYEPFEI